MKTKTKKIIYFGALVLLIIVAFSLRVYNIENAPSGIYPDEAVNGTDALYAYTTGDYKWFYTDNNGREGLFMNLIAIAYSFFGVTILGLKMPSILFGTLSVLGTYLLSKELFRSQRAALLVAFLVAFSFWSINFSRIAFRAIMLPAILSFSTYYLFVGLRTKKYLPFIFGGFIFGLGLHSYIAWRIAPAILGMLFLAVWITKKYFIREYWKQSLVFIFFMAVSMAPLLLDFYHHPEYLTSRSAEVSVLSPTVNHGKPLLTLSKSFALSIVKYNFWGDQNWRHNYPPYPILNPILGFSFLAGLIYLIFKWFHLLFLRFKHKIRDRKFYVYTFLLAWFFAMLAPEFMTAEGLPHALRSIGTLPVVYIISALPFLWLLGKSDKFGPSYKIIITSFLAISLIFIATFNTIKYHYFWANNPKQAAAFEKNLMTVSNYLPTIPVNKKKVVIAENMQIIPIKLFNYNLPNTYRVHPHLLDNLPKKFSNGNDCVFVLTEKQQWIADKIISLYPQLELKIFKNSANQEVWTVQ